MKFKSKNIVIIIVLIIIFFISLTIPKQRSESFKDGECSSSVQTELQSKIISKIHQPIINEKNKVVDADSVVYNIREILSETKYKECDQVTEIETILKEKSKDGASPETILSALNSYYTTKTK
jgi:hypothetical protein